MSILGVTEFIKRLKAACRSLEIAFPTILSFFSVFYFFNYNNAFAGFKKTSRLEWRFKTFGVYFE